MRLRCRVTEGDWANNSIRLVSFIIVVVDRCSACPDAKPPWQWAHFYFDEPRRLGMEESYPSAAVVVGRCHERERWEADVSSVIRPSLQGIVEEVRSHVGALV